MALTTTAKEILRKARDGDDDTFPDQFWALIERYRAELLNQAFAILFSFSDAEDVVQESFCEAFFQKEHLVEAHSIGAWLRKINRANALDLLRKRKSDKNTQERKGKEDPSEKSTTGGFGVIDTREALAKAIEALEPKTRRIVILRYWEHLSYQQISEHLGIPPKTVWNLVFDASRRLREKVDGQRQGTNRRPPQ